MATEITWRNDIRLSDLDSEAKVTKSISSLGGTNYKTQCPECGRNAFTYNGKLGIFHCFHCEIHGKLVDFKAERETSAPVKKQATQRTAPSTMQSSEQGAMQVQDYGSLPPYVLDGIEDLSMDETVSGSQLAVRKYLEKMHIPLGVACLQGVGVANMSMKLDGEENAAHHDCIVYRNYVEGYCCNAKYRTVGSRKKTQLIGGKSREYELPLKGFTQESATKPCPPYNIDSLRPGQDEVPDTLYITEGEKDCLSLLALGFTPAISVASGAATNHARSFEAFREWLAPIRTVVVCGDQDEKGREMAQALAGYFADREVRIARWDKRLYGKDISDVRLQAGDEVARQLVNGAERTQQDEVIDYDSDEQVQRVVDNARGLWDRGYDVGMGPLVDAHLRLSHAGGLIVATGTPGSGKTDFINYLTLHLAALYDSHVCYCSFETPDKYRHAAQLAQLWAGSTNLELLPAADVRPIVQRVTRHVTHLELARQSPTPQLILRKAEQVMARHPNMRYLVIDPYLYISLPTRSGQNQTDAIKEMLVEIAAWARDRRVWVLLVAHPRMLQQSDGSSNFEDINYYTIAGSAHWANVSDYILCIRRFRGEEPEYTELSVLKVRDQSLCTPGTVYLQRQACGRYDARPDKEHCRNDSGACDEEMWG